MPRVMERIVPVKSINDKLQALGSIERNTISIVTALTRLGESDKANLVMNNIKDWAVAEYAKAIETATKMNEAAKLEEK